jgi:two-component system sensor histidine kinase NreB
MNTELEDLKYALDESSIVAITNPQGLISYVNDKFCEISKYSREELLGKDHRIINSGYHSIEFFKNLWETIASGKVWKGDIKNRAKDGTFYWVNTTIVPFLNDEGKPYQHLAIRTEITEHKRIEEKLHSSLNDLIDLKAALDVSSIVAMTDVQGRINYVNDTFCEVSKYSREELLGKDHRIINSGYHSKEFFGNLWRTIASGKVWKGDIKNRAKDGTFYWVNTTIVPFLNDKGKPYQYLAIRTEVTERKRVEEELKMMMTKMITVQEEERKKVSSDLHDGIGQSLYSLLISVNRLSSELDHPLLGQMQGEVSQLIEEIRGIAWELRPSVLDDLGLVPAIRSFIQRFSKHYGIRVHFHCSLTKRLDVQVETSIYRIIQEALTNIRKYAVVEEAFVHINETDGNVQVLIEDKGKGFNPEQQIRGVGLFSMEERARVAGGSVQVYSRHGEGTRVSLYIPVAN